MPAGDALRNSLDLAQVAERAGYHRDEHRGHSEGFARSGTDEYDGGDHTIVVGRDPGADGSRPPLLFHRGRHGALEGRIAS